MASFREKNSSSRRLLNHLDDFYHDIVTGNTISNSHENVVVNAGTGDQNFTVSNSVGNVAAK